MEEAAKTNWVIYSERALDTLCLSGLRGRLSRGILEPVRKSYSLDGSKVVLHRPVLNGKVEDITQGDLDILRAVVTHYVFEHGYSSDRADTPVDDELLVVIRPDQIRNLLRVNRHYLPTKQITYSLEKLQGLHIEADYHVRSAKGSEVLSVTGSLFKLGTSHSPSKKRIHDYALYFDTLWGRAFLHNVRCGNFVVVRDIPYLKLDNGDKSLFYMVMSMPKAQFFRKKGKLLKLINSNDDQNRPRAIKRMESYLDHLTDLKLITWRLDGDVYYVSRLYNPIKGAMPKLALDSGSERREVSITSEERVVEIDTDSTVTNHGLELQVVESWFERFLFELKSKERRSQWEEMQYGIIEAVNSMRGHTERMFTEESTQSYKLAVLRRHWNSFSPYYTWTQVEFRKWFYENKEEIRWKEEYEGFREIFKRIEANSKLQDDLIEWTTALEQFYESRLTCWREF